MASLLVLCTQKGCFCFGGLHTGCRPDLDPVLGVSAQCRSLDRLPLPQFVLSTTSTASLNKLSPVEELFTPYLTPNFSSTLAPAEIFLLFFFFWLAVCICSAPYRMRRQ